jgi:PD-(D/E)XK nuclease superfamily protein
MLYLSSTSLHTWLRCRKQYELSYILGLEPKVKPEAMGKGSDFHKCMEYYAKCVMQAGLASSDLAGHFATSAMRPVVEEYVLHNGFPDKDQLMSAELPYWCDLIPGVRLRITPDLVYRSGEWIVCRDWKTFSKDGEWDVDLDFQGRLYTALLRQHFKTEKVRFEYVKVRSELGRELKKGYVAWTNAERYPEPDELIPSKAECDILLEEAQYAAREILKHSDTRQITPGALYRSPQRGFDMNSCDRCLVKEACKKDLTGELDEQTISLLYNIREPLKEVSNG